MTTNHNHCGFPWNLENTKAPLICADNTDYFSCDQNSFNINMNCAWLPIIETCLVPVQSSYNIFSCITTSTSNEETTDCSHICSQFDKEQDCTNSSFNVTGACTWTHDPSHFHHEEEDESSYGLHPTPSSIPMTATTAMPTAAHVATEETNHPTMQEFSTNSITNNVTSITTTISIDSSITTNNEVSRGSSTIVVAGSGILIFGLAYYLKKIRNKMLFRKNSKSEEVVDHLQFEHVSLPDGDNDDEDDDSITELEFDLP